jgi:hypothetical protein
MLRPRGGRWGWGTAQVIDRHSFDGVARTENAVAVGVVPPEQRGVQIEYEVVRRIFNRRNLFEYDLSFEIEVFRTQQRCDHQVSQNIQRNGDVRVQHPRLKARVLPCSIRVQ